VLTGSYTASASELVINGLKPYMNVFLIGTKTYGKNVGSSTFYKENDSKNKWGLQPIIAKFYNSDGKSDFTDGFAPDIYDPDSWNMPKKELGDVNEALLELAIGHITGAIAPQKLQTRSIQYLPELGSSLESKAWRNQIIMDNR
jgi:C-terminal processing protease CtpA/Prc